MNEWDALRAAERIPEVMLGAKDAETVQTCECYVQADVARTSALCVAAPVTSLCRTDDTVADSEERITDRR